MNSPSAISRSRPRIASNPFGKTLRTPSTVTDATYRPLLARHDGGEAAIQLLLDQGKDRKDRRRPDQGHEHQPLPVDVPLADIHEYADRDRLQVRRPRQERDC